MPVRLTNDLNSHEEQMHSCKNGFLLPLAALAIAIATTSPSEAANSIVNVSLWDKGASSDMATDLGMGMSAHDMSKATMGVKVSPASVKAGEVTFEVKNNSKDTVHEMIVAPIEDTSKTLPYITDENRVDEDGAGHLGEVSELEPGKSGALQLKLDPGKYVLFCNIPGHFMNGMWTVLTVK
jgi:uncharacterized cupredoxin-like copper-binding protein